jgi:tRNA dimethylallyltransferase
MTTIAKNREGINITHPRRKPKIIVIVGPTASGKTALAIRLAKKYNGEIISADSRQVYRGMDIGTGKATHRERREAIHHLIDVASPKRTFTAADFRAHGRHATAQILRHGKTPIICGGTGFYIDALLTDTSLPDIPPHPLIRKKLEPVSTEKLFTLLEGKDSRRAKNIDPFNRRRLIRALEIIAACGKPVPPRLAVQSDYHILFIGLHPNAAILRQKIRVRLLARIRQGMIAEVRRLHNAGISWKRLDDFGLEYRFVSRYLRGIITKSEMFQLLEKAINQYAKRQMTWFRRNRDIHWITNAESADRLVAPFLSKKTAPKKIGRRIFHVKSKNDKINRPGPVQG